MERHDSRRQSPAAPECTPESTPPPQRPDEGVVDPPLAPAWGLRPSHALSRQPLFESEDAWQQACGQADLLGRALLRREEATRRELASIGFPTADEDLERLFFEEQRQPPTDRRKRRKWQRARRGFQALISLRQVRTAIAFGQFYSAVHHALAAGLASGILDAAERGARTAAAASSGGKAFADVRRSKITPKRQAWQRQAEELWRRHPTLSKSRVAELIADSSASLDVIRRHIRKP